MSQGRRWQEEQGERSSREGGVEFTGRGMSHSKPPLNFIKNKTLKV